MRFETPLKPGNNVTIEYEAIEWDESVVPETFECTGERRTVVGRVEKVIPERASVDEHARVDADEGKHLVFANGDVFSMTRMRGHHDELIGIRATIDVDSPTRFAVERGTPTKHSDTLR